MNRENALDPRYLTFSQAQGYEELPQPLKLEELPGGARNRLWNLLHKSAYSLPFEGFTPDEGFRNGWYEICFYLHTEYYELPSDELGANSSEILHKYKQKIIYSEFNKLFDLLQAIMRHKSCPQDFTQAVATIFKECRLAYVVDVRSPPTIYPAATEQEGEAVLRAVAELGSAGLAGAERHLRQASECINQGDYPGAVRESIHAVESTARSFDPKARSLAQALNSLEAAGGLHPALKKAFSKLYGYTSDEQGIRHALIDNPQPNVDLDEAIFMLGACASFSSFLARKHRHPVS